MKLMTEKPENIDFEGLCVGRKKKPTTLSKLLGLSTPYRNGEGSRPVTSTVSNPIPFPVPIPIQPPDQEDNDGDDDDGDDDNEEEEEEEEEETTAGVTTEGENLWRVLDRDDDEDGGVDLERVVKELKATFISSLTVMGVVITFGLLLSVKIGGRAVRRAVAQRMMDVRTWREAMTRERKVLSKKSGSKRREDLVDFRELGELRTWATKLEEPSVMSSATVTEMKSQSAGAARCSPAPERTPSPSQQSRGERGEGKSDSTYTSDSEIFVDEELYKSPVPTYNHKKMKKTKKVKAR